MILWNLTSPHTFPPPEEWLSAEERRRVEELRVPKRRHDWLLGRLSAKRLVRHLWANRDIPPPLSVIEIASAASGAPFPRLAAEAAPLGPLAPGEPFPFALSISHSSGCALSAAALTHEALDGLGADLEKIEARTPGFVADFFAPDERALVYRSPERDLLVTAIWSAKEAVLKALGVGLSADTRDVVCRPRDSAHLTSAWKPFTVELCGSLAGRATRVDGAWRRLREYVVTLARAAAPASTRSVVLLDPELHAQPV